MDENMVPDRIDSERDTSSINTRRTFLKSAAMITAMGGLSGVASANQGRDVRFSAPSGLKGLFESDKTKTLLESLNNPHLEFDRVTTSSGNIGSGRVAVTTIPSPAGQLIYTSVEEGADSIHFQIGQREETDAIKRSAIASLPKKYVEMYKKEENPTVSVLTPGIVTSSGDAVDTVSRFTPDTEKYPRPITTQGSGDEVPYVVKNWNKETLHIGGCRVKNSFTHKYAQVSIELTVPFSALSEATVGALIGWYLGGLGVLANLDKARKILSTMMSAGVGIVNDSNSYTFGERHFDHDVGAGLQTFTTVGITPGYKESAEDLTAVTPPMFGHKTIH